MSHSCPRFDLAAIFGIQGLSDAGSLLSFTGYPMVREKSGKFIFSIKAREKSGSSVKCSGKLEILQKMGKSPEILISCFVRLLKN